MQTTRVIAFPAMSGFVEVQGNALDLVGFHAVFTLISNARNDLRGLILFSYSVQIAGLEDQLS